MAKESIQTVIHHIRGLVVARDTAGLGDSTLLERFLTQRDEAAFEALVRRHGPMVLGVCRRILKDLHDAEDAFQATFLVFVRKAASITDRKLLGNWLYGVAYRTARAARSAAGRRRAKEAKAVPRQQPPEEDVWQELLPLLDQELSRLPDKYRTPVILCDLEGMSRRNAAQELGLPEGTLSSRLARARAILARRLARRGVTLTTGALAVCLGRHATAALRPSSLVVSTVKAGTLILAGQSVTAGLISAKVAALIEGVVKTMFLCKLKIAMAVLMGSILVIGMGEVASRHLWAARTPLEPPDGKQKGSQPGGAFHSEQGKRQASPTPSSVSNNTKALLEQALETAGTITDPPSKFQTLMSIAWVQNKTGDSAGAQKTWQAALEVAKTIASAPLKVSALVNMTYARWETGDRAAAMKTLQQAEEAAIRMPIASQKGNALEQVVNAQAILGNYEEGLRTVASSGDFLASFLGMFARSLSTENKPAARKALQQAFEMGKNIQSRPDKTSAMSAIAAAQAKAGDLEGALQTADALGDRKFTALQAIAAVCAKAGAIESALGTAKIIRNEEARAGALLAIAVAEAKAGDRAAAQGTLQEVRRIVDHLQNDPGLRGGGRPFRTAGVTRIRGQIAITQVRLGDLAGATQTASALPSDFDKAKALVEIGSAHAAAGNRVDAREILLAAARAAQNVTPGTGMDGPTGPTGPLESAKAATMRQIAEKQANVGDIKDALHTAESIPTNTINMKDNALAAIVQAQAEAGDVQGALETVERIQQDNTKAFALRNLVKAQVKAGDEQGALALAARQTSPLLRVYVLLGVAEGRAKQRATRE